RACWYIAWTERGRSRERSTGTTNRELAEVAFAEWLQRRQQRRSGPRDPAEVLVTDILRNYATKKARAEDLMPPQRLAYAIIALTDFFEGKIASDVTDDLCDQYAKVRKRSNGTIRRELGVLRAAINGAHKSGELTRAVSVKLPEADSPRERWLT